VGNELLRHELAAAESPPLPLYLAVAQTQAEIGALAVSELEPVTGGPAAVVLTRVEVAADDPAFSDPTKPIGPFYDESRARALERERGWRLREDAGRGWRRVVPSPRPLGILELDVIRALAAAGTTVVAAGGGGVPVVARNGRYDGVDAVIDKDFAAALVGSLVGATTLLLVTGVEQVALDFGTPEERPLERMTAAEARGWLAEGQFPPGSMGPKIEAAVQFVEAGGEHAIVTSLDRMAEALAGRAGTRVVA
jgi:carbamate kinase